MDLLNLNERLSKQLQVKLLEPDEIAEFELVNLFKKEPGREEPSVPDWYQHVERQFIYDPGANDGKGGSVMIENITGVKFEMNQATKQSTQVPEVKKPEFNRGVCKVSYEEPNTYIYMMRSKSNLDNPFRGKKSYGMKFRIRNKKKENYEKLQDLDISWEAEKIIRDSGWDKVRAIQVKLNQSKDSRFHTVVVEGDLPGLKLSMITLAKKFPKVIIRNSDDIAAKNRVYIHDGVAFNILMWTPESFTWSLYNPSVKDKVTFMTQVDPGKDKVEALLEHFKTQDGRNQYAMFVNLLNRILKGVNSN